MKFTRTLAILAIASTMATGFSQFDSGPSATAAWESFKLPNKTIKLDFRNASPDMVLSLFTKTSGITIVKDPTLTQPLSLTTAKAVPLKQAFEILNAALSVRNFELKKEGTLLVIRAKPRNDRGRGGQGNTPFDPNMLRDMMQGGQRQENDLKVYPIKFAAASSVARVINEVFMNQQANRSGLPMMFQMGGRGGRGGNPFQNLFGGGQQEGMMVRASADDFSNSVIVNAPREQQTEVADFIKQIDKETDQPLKAAVYKLEYASAADLQTPVLNLLISNQPKGRGASSGTQNIDRQFSFFPGGGQNNQQQRALVSSDPRTNSLIVTTTEENQKLVAQVIKDLDTEVTVQTSTFVFPLDNARADDIASLLQSTFGNRNGGRGGTAGGTNRNRGTTNQQNRNNQNRNNQGGGNRLGGGLNSEYLDIDLADQGADAGELQTNVTAQGGFFNFGGFGGQGGQNNQNRNNAQLQGRDPQGRLVPVQDPTNQVTVIPDPNTNSIIVVTSPEYADVIRQILGQLDKIPEQVMIETIIVEASLDSSDKLGVDWTFNQAKAFGDTGVTGVLGSNFGTSPTAQGLRYTLGGGNLSVVMNALKSDSKFQVLSTPRIFTSNNVQAEINISQRVPFVTSSRTDANGNLTYTYDFEDVGIVLTVTPRITSNGYVTMDVSQTANDLQGFTDFNAPIVNQRQADTTVAVKDGDTIILGGIIRNTVTSTVRKVPLLGDIPILGNLFKSTDKRNNKTELMVFLTPRVVRNPDEATALRKAEQEKLSKQSLTDLQKTIGGGGGEIQQTPVKKVGGGK